MGIHTSNHLNAIGSSVPVIDGSQRNLSSPISEHSLASRTFSVAYACSKSKKRSWDIPALTHKQARNVKFNIPNVLYAPGPGFLAPDFSARRFSKSQPSFSTEATPSTPCSRAWASAAVMALSELRGISRRCVRDLSGSRIKTHMGVF